MSNFMKILKANPNHDAKGLFAKKSYHGTNVGDLIQKEGFKVVSGSNGQLLGEGVYLTSDLNLAKSYGSMVLEVQVNSSKIKEFKKEPEYKKWAIKNGWDMASPASLSSFMKEKGFDGVTIDKVTVVFDPSKLVAGERVHKAAAPTTKKMYVVLKK